MIVRQLHCTTNVPKSPKKNLEANLFNVYEKQQRESKLPDIYMLWGIAPRGEPKPPIAPPDIDSTTDTDFTCYPSGKDPDPVRGT